MKNRLVNKALFFLSLLAAGLFTSCSDWTDTENINETDLFESIKTEEYYAALREWKKTPGLPQVWCWYDNWNAISPVGDGSLRGLPDSVTIAADWGAPKFNLPEQHRLDKEYVQKVKGTKVVFTLFCSKAGNDVEWHDDYDIGDSSDPELVRKAMRRYAEAIYDACVADDYDGFDWDYEPAGGGGSQNYLWKNKVQRRIFVEELGYWFGSGSQRTDRGDRKPAKPGLLFIVDGEIGTRGRMDKDWESQYIDYFVLQTYGVTSESTMKTRVSGVIEDMSEHIAAGRITKEEVVRRTIMTEDFESNANTGGGLLKQASYVHNADGINQQIGGFGIYRVAFDYPAKAGQQEYQGSSEYWFLRNGITRLYNTFYERQKTQPQP